MEATRTRSSLRGGLVTAVAPGSPAAAAGLAVGDLLEAINDQVLEDLIDYRFAIAEPAVEIRYWRAGECHTAQIRKDIDADLGLAFDQAVFDRIRQCANRCEFCFIHQMPGYPGSQAAMRHVEVPMRRSLYLEDDDYRLSFLQGNFITMTNLSEREWKRIFSLRLSPLYISIHTTNPALRVELLQQPLAARLHAQLDRLAAEGIAFHGQIVLVPGRNDGAELDRTIAEAVARWHPHLLSLCIVPFGATRFRPDNQLKELPLPDPTWCRQVIRQVKIQQRRFGRAHGDPIVRLADEFYILSGEAFPGAAHYAGFPNLGDGLGGTRLLWEQWRKYAKRLPQQLAQRRHAILVTGQAATGVLSPIVARLNEVQQLTVRLLPLASRYWGERITVTGLLTGQDLAEGLLRDRGQTVWIPDIMLRAGSRTFLDELTVEDVAARTGTQLQVLTTDALGIYTAAIEPERLGELQSDRWYGSYYA
ncbi:MAG: DUF512 domain-containing protein [Cyanobacteria bacterium REEB65]|nr:DUF512 domain-containing protein [Cyanobacteria bacterium REEB65]